MTDVIWFRHDLRLEDQTALYHAMKTSKDLILLFHVNPTQFIDHSFNHQAFFQAVQFFQTQVNEQMHLQILYGDIRACFTRLKAAVPSWAHIYYNADESGFGLQRDQDIADFFVKNDIKVHAYQDHYMHHADLIKTQSGQPYKVFTPYYNRWKEMIKPTPLQVSLVPSIVVKDELFPKDEAEFANLCASLPQKPFYELGSKAAKRRFKAFTSNHLADYETNRDFPAVSGTSLLSPYLRTGELSIRTVWSMIALAENSIGKQTFQKELCWRDFYNLIYKENPNQKTESIKKEFQHINWNKSETDFQKWCQGQTGYPIIDAAMAQLNETGWMHNRLRMIVASFLIKDLLIDWRKGEKYFQQQLIDYSPASNIGGWQWAASTGTDAVPYFRIFNPVTQSEKFDASGDFIRTYLPTLKEVPDELIHQPWKMTELDESLYGVVLGKDYPHPIVVHKTARLKTLAAYEDSKAYAGDMNELKH